MSGTRGAGKRFDALRAVLARAWPRDIACAPQLPPPSQISLSGGPSVLHARFASEILATSAIFKPRSVPLPSRAAAAAAPGPSPRSQMFPRHISAARTSGALRWPPPGRRRALGAAAGAAPRELCPPQRGMLCRRRSLCRDGQLKPLGLPKDLTKKVPSACRTLARVLWSVVLWSVGARARLEAAVVPSALQRGRFGCRRPNRRRLEATGQATPGSNLGCPRTLQTRGRSCGALGAT